MTHGIEYPALSTATLLRMGASHVYKEAQQLKRVATIGGDWDDPRDRRQYESDMALYDEMSKRATLLEAK